MIQLTKGTNVLDINLSDFSGAGQDVVQNGSFTDIGSDLILNGDFAEIGSDLVTNGDFSDAGINLVSNPNFTDGVEKIVDGDFPLPNVNWTTQGTSTINGGSATVEGLGNLSGSHYFRGISQLISISVGTSYKITFTAKQLTGSGAMYAGLGYTQPFSQVITNDYVEYTFYQVPNNVSGQWSYMGFGGAVGNTFEIKDVSVKELGADWEEISVDPDSASFGENGLTIVQSSDVGLDNRVFQTSVTEDDKSYKVTYTIHSISLTSGNSVKYYNGAAYVVLPEQGVGTHTFYYTRQGTLDNWIFNLATPVTSATDFVTISSISVQELGEGWTINNADATHYVEFIETGARFVSDTISPVLTLRQDVVESGKFYKITCDATYAVGSGAARFKIGNINTSSIQEGSNVLYLSAATTTTTSYIERAAADVDVVLTNITVQEVGQDWTLGTGASIGEDKLVINGGDGLVVYQPSIVNVTGYYIISFVVSDYSQGYIKGNVSSVVGDSISSDGPHTQYIQGASTANVGVSCTDSFIGNVTDIVVKQLDTNGRWVTFADPDSKSVMKLGQVDLEIDSSGNNCGVYQTGLIKPNKLYIITINMKATAAINVEIAASLGTAVSAVIGTETLTTSYVEYSYEYVTPFAVDHDLQIHRLFGSGADQTISIDYVSMNGVDESKWINDPTWDPFATSLVFVPTLTDESTNNSKQFTLDTSIADGGWDGRSLHGQVIINQFPTEAPAAGIINLEQPNFLEGFYQVEIRGYLGTFYRILGKGMAHLERASTEDGYNRFEAYNDSVTYKAYEE